MYYILIKLLFKPKTKKLARYSVYINNNFITWSVSSHLAINRDRTYMRFIESETF